MMHRRGASCDFELTGGFFEKGVFVPGDGWGGGSGVKNGSTIDLCCLAGIDHLYIVFLCPACPSLRFEFGVDKKVPPKPFKGKPYLFFVFPVDLLLYLDYGCILLGDQNVPPKPSEEEQCLKKR